MTSAWWTQRRGYAPHRLRKHQHSREHHKKDTQNQHGHAAILETGLVYFFYRPKARIEDDPDRQPHDLDDISRLYVLLSPKGEDPVAPKEWVNLAQHGPGPVAEKTNRTPLSLNKRLLVIPRKKLPDIDQHERLLGVVAKVGNLHDVRKVLEEGDDRQTQISTPTGGGAKRQLVPEDRRARDIEAMVERDVQAYLNGLAPLPEEPAEIPDNPTVTPTFVPVNPPALLDEEGAQVILVGAAAKLDEELGRAGRVLQGVEEIDERYFLRSDSKPFEELHLHKRLHSSSPSLRSGDWS